ncbi:MAG: ribbon-helix-helix domain-containing protein [Pseudonocardiales bacterium]
MHRTRVLLEDEQYEHLKEQSARTGRSIGKLIRKAMGGSYSGSQVPARRPT